MSHRPSSNPTHMWAPGPEGAFWLSASSFEESSGTYSRHRTAEPTSRLFTALGMGLLREKISICPWEPSPPPPTCGKRKMNLKKGRKNVETPFEVAPLEEWLSILVKEKKRDGQSKEQGQSSPLLTVTSFSTHSLLAAGKTKMTSPCRRCCW